MTLPAPISLRLPEALKDLIQKAATDAGRSLNAEIRMRLEASFSGGAPVTVSTKMLSNEVETLRKELRQTHLDFSERLKAMEDALKENGIEVIPRA